jgi:hypothetical protein
VEKIVEWKKRKKNPSRWRPAYVCRQVKEGSIPLKQEILNHCDDRNDSLAEEVRVRISGALSDLHAADARYHRDCYSSFMSFRNIKAAQTENLQKPVDEGLQKII